MTTPDPQAARKWAKQYLAACKPRMDEFMGRTGDLSYDREMLKECLRIEETGGCYNVQLIGGIVGLFLLNASAVDPVAFELLREIIAKNRRAGCNIPDAWRDFEYENTLGKTKRPKNQGRTRSNGVRDLIFKFMAVHLRDKFGLDLSRNDQNSGRQGVPSACEIIEDEFRAIGENPPAARSIEKAVRNLE